MKTEIAGFEALPEAVQIMKQGVPVAFATETVYGLGAPAFSESAVREIFKVKGRPSDNPLIVHVSGWEMLEEVAESIPRTARLLAERFWPGPLTLVLQRGPRVPAIVSAGLDTVAVRMPAHLMARALIEGLGEPIVAPSANLSGKPSPTNALDVLEDLQGRIPLILDGGECPLGIESTVVGLYGTPTLLRPGSISREEIEAVLGETLSAPLGPVTSPGMKYRHYAPKARLRVVSERSAFEKGRREGVFPIETIEAKSLYRLFRQADREGCDEILLLVKDQLSEALLNRIQKACQ